MDVENRHALASPRVQFAGDGGLSPIAIFHLFAGLLHPSCLSASFQGKGAGVRAVRTNLARPEEVF